MQRIAYACQTIHAFLISQVQMISFTHFCSPRGSLASNPRLREPHGCRIAGHRIRRGFSLIEVILAISLFSILLIGIAIIFGSVLNSSRKIFETDQTLNTVGALQEGLQRREFSTVYQWTRDHTDLFLFNFRASTNLPVTEGSDQLQSAVAANGESTGGLDYVLHPTLRPEGDPRLADEVEALEGYLYRVSLSVMTNNPGGTNLPDIGAFTNAYLSVLATIDRVPSRSLDADAAREPIFQIPVVINR